jgi:hypothetical protein
VALCEHGTKSGTDPPLPPPPSPRARRFGATTEELQRGLGYFDQALEELMTA